MFEITIWCTMWTNQQTPTAHITSRLNTLSQSVPIGTQHGTTFAREQRAQHNANVWTKETSQTWHERAPMKTLWGLIIWSQDIHSMGRFLHCCICAIPLIYCRTRSSQRHQTTLALAPVSCNSRHHNLASLHPFLRLIWPPTKAMLFWNHEPIPFYQQRTRKWKQLDLPVVFYFVRGQRYWCKYHDTHAWTVDTSDLQGHSMPLLTTPWLLLFLESPPLLQPPPVTFDTFHQIDVSWHPQWCGPSTLQSQAHIFQTTDVLRYTESHSR